MLHWCKGGLQVCICTSEVVVIESLSICLRLDKLKSSNCLDKSAETGDGLAYDERIHFACAFVGVNGFGISYETAHLVVEQDAVASQQFWGVAHRLAHLHGTVGLGQRGMFVAHDSGILHLR